MKPAAVAVCFLLAGCGVLLGDSPDARPASRERAPLLRELVAMTRTGSSEVTVLAFAKAHRMELPSEVSDDDLLWLRRAGVSERVVGYMRAIDVRGTDERAPETAASETSEDSTRSAAVYSSGTGDLNDDASGYADRYAGGYPDSGYDVSSPGYYQDYDPFFFPGYFPYSSYYFIERGFPFRGFHGRGHRLGGHRGFDGGRGFRAHRGGPGGSREAWRARDFRGRRGDPVVVAPRGQGRPAFARGGPPAGPRAPRGAVVGPRGSGHPAFARGGLPHGFSGPRGGAIGRGGPGHSGPSGVGRAGGGFSRGPTVSSGMGRGPAGSPGARGRR